MSRRGTQPVAQVLQTANQSLSLTNSPSENLTCSLISTAISNPPSTSTTTSTRISKTIMIQSITPHQRRNIIRLSLSFSIITRMEVEILRPIKYPSAQPPLQPLLHSQPRAITPSQQSILPTQQAIMADAAEHQVLSHETDAAQPDDSTPQNESCNYA